MTVSKIIRSLSFGFIFGILAIGLLPFLIVFNWAEMLNFTELEASPLFLVATRFINGSWKSRTSKPSKQNVDSNE
ncbi:hypothetical protein FHS15_001689 [Paenibacillus castaneae]|uniref:hypothetical protein n=1 Tax=Paenibacillus castaneae TaxID=474957 RepID=UPI000C99E2A3|nr:hypothetical protein [Paenibacillus castaneae]NIK76564.1 hypothetical protein [Paenibacillus castaneae]